MDYSISHDEPGTHIDTLGLQITYEDLTHIYLRAMEERGHHCVILKKAETGSVGVLGFKLWDEPDLEPIKWDMKDPQRQTLWGAPVPKSWFEPCLSG